MQLISVLPAQTPARELERVLGDPFNPDAPISFRKLVRHDEREEPPSEAFEMLRASGVHAQLVPQAFGGRLTSFEELLALVRVVSRRDLVLTTGLGSTMLAAIPVWAWGDKDQRHQVAQMLLGDGAFGSFAVSEREAGSDFLATTARAEAADGGYLLTGEKWLIGGMALGAADTALRLALGWGRDRRLYGKPIHDIPAVRTLLLGSFIDILIAECVTVITARALTLAPRRASLWAAVTKYLVPNLSERIVRDASVVLSARSYLREGVGDGIFQKIARDMAITSIFEGTQLVQLSMIASKLAQLVRIGRR